MIVAIGSAIITGISILGGVGYKCIYQTNPNESTTSTLSNVTIEYIQLDDKPKSRTITRTLETQDESEQVDISKFIEKDYISTLEISIKDEPFGKNFMERKEKEDRRKELNQ